MNVKALTQAASIFLKKHAPEICTGIGIAGMTTAIILAAKTSPQYRDVRDRLIEIRRKGFTKKDRAKLIIKYYGPIIFLSAASVGSIISGCALNLRRNAFLTTALAATEVTLSQYKQQTVDLLARQAVKNASKSPVEPLQAPIEARPVNASYELPPEAPEGTVAAYEASTKQKFFTSVEKVRAVENDINEQIFQGFTGMMTLNDYYAMLGLDETVLGNDAWWDINHRCHLDVDSTLKDGKLALLITPKNYTT